MAPLGGFLGGEVSTVGEKLSWDELMAALSFLSACALAVTIFTELMLQAIERKQQELEEREYWRSLWHFPGSTHP
jgi:hypothetical protein